jgi:hypothetical protein
LAEQVRRTDLDGVPYVIAQNAETRGRRLYIDGEPFPWATSGEPGEHLRVERAGVWSVLWVPVVVDGPVTIHPARHRPRDGHVHEQATPAVSYRPDDES